MIALGSDHAGFEYKERMKQILEELRLTYRDFGTHSKDSSDYPDWAHAVAQSISTGESDRGILICGTGIGMSIVANKHRGVRAAACESVTAARLARQHNDANILTLGARITGWESAVDIVKTFLATSFDGGRHQKRIDKIQLLTKL